jgi:hypothetical protein
MGAIAAWVPCHAAPRRPAAQIRDSVAEAWLMQARKAHRRLLEQYRCGVGGTGGCVVPSCRTADAVHAAASAALSLTVPLCHPHAAASSRDKAVYLARKPMEEMRLRMLRDAGERG